MPTRKGRQASKAVPNKSCVPHRPPRPSPTRLVSPRSLPTRLSVGSLALECVFPGRLASSFSFLKEAGKRSQGKTPEACSGQGACQTNHIAWGLGKTHQKPTKQQKNTRNQAKEGPKPKAQARAKAAPEAKVTPKEQGGRGPRALRAHRQKDKEAPAKGPTKGAGDIEAPSQALPPQQSPIRPCSGAVTAGRELRSAFRPSDAAVAITCQGGFCIAACAMHPAPCAVRVRRAPRAARRAPRAARRARRARRGSTAQGSYYIHTYFQQGGYGGGGLGWGGLGLGKLPLLCLSCDCCQKGATLSLPTEGVGHSGACACLKGATLRPFRPGAARGRRPQLRRSATTRQTTQGLKAFAHRLPE